MIHWLLRPIDEEDRNRASTNCSQSIVINPILQNVGLRVISDSYCRSPRSSSRSDLVEIDDSLIPNALENRLEGYDHLQSLPPTSFRRTPSAYALCELL